MTHRTLELSHLQRIGCSLAPNRFLALQMRVPDSSYARLSGTDRIFSLEPADYKTHFHEYSQHSSQVLQTSKKRSHSTGENQSNLISRKKPLWPLQKWRSSERAEVLRRRAAIRGQVRGEMGSLNLHHQELEVMGMGMRDGGGTELQVHLFSRVFSPARITKLMIQDQDDPGFA